MYGQGGRKPHVLQPNKASQRPRHLIFVDTETKPISISNTEDQHVLKLGWACYVRMGEERDNRQPVWCYFTTIKEFWDFVSLYVQPKIKLYLIAHNIGFDFRILKGFEYMQKNKWKLTFFYNKGRTCLMSYRKGKTSIQLLDMTNFYPMSLSRVGKALGVEKQEVDFDLVDDKALSEYCHRDVEIMIKAFKAWLDFLDTHELGNFKHTLPSQAFNAYRHRFMPYEIHIHNNESVCKLERKAYRGGRTEVFWKGSRKGNQYYQLDVNSMYAYVMQQRNYPTKLLGESNRVSMKRLKHLAYRCLVVATVVLDTNLPVFPIHDGVRNVYPIGTFETTLTTPEICFAIEHNMILKVKHVAWYKAYPIFEEYSTYFADLKEQYDREENQVFRTIAKLFGNSLYGKFGQLGMTTKISKHAPKTEPNKEVIVEVLKVEEREKGKQRNEQGKQNRQITTKVWGRGYRLGDDYILERRDGESFNSFPAIAAHVTAYARMYLWSLFMIAGRENVYYTDTDCLMVNQSGYERLKPLLDDHQLGKLKVEKQARSLTIHAAKDYRLGDKVRIKGIRSNAIEVDHNVFEQDQFLGLPGAIQKERPDLVTIKRTQKTLSREVKTGYVLPSGWVTPFRLPEAF